MKIMREILAVFLAVMFITLTCGGGFADMDVGDTNYTLGGYISLGGGWLSDQPRHMSRAYLKKYVAFPQGFLAYTDLTVKSKDGLEYYKYWMSEPGLTGAQEYLLQAGKLGVYHAQIEYDQLQNLYCDVNPFNNHIGILLQRLRFSGWFNPTLDITIFVENDFLRRTGWQPLTQNGGPGNPYNFTAGVNLRPINYKQNDMRVGAEYDQPQVKDQNSVFQARVSYHLSTFENGEGSVIGRQPPIGNFRLQSLPPSNMANYVTAEGALNLKSYLTRITGSLSYGWLSQNDFVYTGSTNAANIPPVGLSHGLAGLSANTFTANIAGLTRPIAPLALRYSYNAYNYSNNNTGNQLLNQAFGAIDNPSLLLSEHYSYFRQAVNLGADYRVNQMLAFNLGYTWKGVSRTEGQGTTNSSSPQVGVRLLPTDWLSLLANYTFTTRSGYNNTALLFEAGEVAVPMTYKFYSGSLTRNNFNFIAEVYPVDTLTCSLNFSIYNDNFTDSTFGIQSDRGWSSGMDVSWRPHDRVALSLGYDHQQLQTRELAVANLTPFGEAGNIGGDAGPTLTTSDSYDTFSARADIKLIPKKLTLTTRASYALANSNFNNWNQPNKFMPNLNEYYADIRTFLTYQHNEHWAVRAGYIFEIFGMSDAYGQLYLQGIQANGGAPFNNQRYNTLDGFYRNATAHIVQGFLQYKF